MGRYYEKLLWLAEMKSFNEKLPRKMDMNKKVCKFIIHTFFLCFHIKILHQIQKNNTKIYKNKADIIILTYKMYKRRKEKCRKKETGLK